MMYRTRQFWLEYAGYMIDILVICFFSVIMLSAYVWCLF